MRNTQWLLVLFILFSSFLSGQDKIILKSGIEYKGKILSVDETTITFNIWGAENKIRKFHISLLSTIKTDNGGTFDAKDFYKYRFDYDYFEINKIEPDQKVIVVLENNGLLKYPFIQATDDALILRTTSGDTSVLFSSIAVVWEKRKKNQWQLRLLPRTSKDGKDYSQGLIDGKSQVSGNHNWFFSGLAFNIFGEYLAEITKPNPPAELLIGKSKEYVAGFITGYNNKVNARGKYAKAGSCCNIVVAGCVLLLFSADYGAMVATCFAEGTEITMADGSFKSIEDIQVGDRVLSYNPEAGKTESDEVLELYSTTNNNMMKMKFSDGTVIHSTFDHPYYVKDKGWCSLKPDVTKEIIVNISDVGQLEKGDICLTLVDGELKEIKLVQFKEITVMQKTYTIKRLRKNNSFFAEGILVGVETVKD